MLLSLQEAQSNYNGQQSQSTVWSLISHFASILQKLLLGLSELFSQNNQQLLLYDGRTHQQLSIISFSIRYIPQWQNLQKQKQNVDLCAHKCLQNIAFKHFLV